MSETDSEGDYWEWTKGDAKELQSIILHAKLLETLRGQYAELQRLRELTPKFNANLARACRDLGFSQVELARALGVTRQEISRRIRAARSAEGDNG